MEHTERLDEILESIRNSFDANETGWNEFFAELSKPQYDELRSDPDLWDLRLRYYFLIRSEEEARNACISAARNQCPEQEATLYIHTIYRWPHLRDTCQSDTVTTAQNMADELAASNDREYILGCIRALLQTFVSDTAPINWIQPVDSERTKLFLNILRFPSPEDAAKYESLFSNLKNRKDSWLSFPERDCSVFDGITNMIIVPWPRTALHRLAIYLGCMDKLWPYLREILLEMCLETKCEECGKVSYKVPVMEFFDLQAVACAECGHLTDQAWCAEGYILGQGFREFFSMARLVNLIQINCAGLSFHETIPVCISAADKLQDFRKRFIEFIKKEVQPCNKKIINIDFEHNIAETLSNPAEGYFNLDFSLTNKLAGLEEEFISAFRSFLDSYYDSM